MLSPEATGVWLLIGHAFSGPASVVKAASDWRVVGRYAESGQVAWARFGGRGAGPHQGPFASWRSPSERPGSLLTEVLCRVQIPTLPVGELLAGHQGEKHNDSGNMWPLPS
ncbi:hypothetical protein QTO34_004361 [Cnephaeus nilssonii]|uniref:Uncharacterized protein n=1 Tax=Cnephaeus nilssonii TaxID=3371016 RepID=A0AA40HP71_CNENI|nr:hypothetical protein QTO34_004361 [Eptesicus nilssonii]